MNKEETIKVMEYITERVKIELIKSRIEEQKFKSKFDGLTTKEINKLIRKERKYYEKNKNNISNR